MKDNEYEEVGRGIIDGVVRNLAAVVGFVAVTAERLIMIAMLIFIPIGIVSLMAVVVALPTYLFGQFLGRFGEWAQLVGYMALGFPAAYWYGGYVVKSFYTMAGEFKKAMRNGFRAKG